LEALVEEVLAVEGYSPDPVRIGKSNLGPKHAIGLDPGARILERREVRGRAPVIIGAQEGGDPARDRKLVAPGREEGPSRRVDEVVAVSIGDDLAGSSVRVGGLDVTALGGSL